MGSAVTITPDQQPSAGPVTITPDQPQTRGFLSRLANDPNNITLDSHTSATMRGLSSIGQGVFQAAEGAKNLVTHPIDTAQKMGLIPSSGSPTEEAARVVSGVKDAIPKDWLGAGDKAGNLAGQTVAGLAAGEVAPKVTLQNAGRVARTAGKVATGVAEDIPVVRQAGRLKKYWDQTAPTPSAPAPPDQATASQSRTMPGQVGREVIAPDQVTPPAKLRPDQLRLPEQTPSTIEGAVKSPARSISGERTVNQKPQPAKPIPSRSGLALPAKPVGSELQDLPATNAKPAAQTGEALGTIRSSSAMQTPKPIQRGSLSQLLQQQLNEGLGAAPPPNPKAPIYQRGQISSAMQEGSDVPQGHTAVEGSSAIRSKMYDPEAREFHARLTSGDTTYVYGDVSPEEASGFEGAKSKGQAFQAMKANHPLVAKIVNGKRMDVRPTRGAIAEGMK